MKVYAVSSSQPIFGSPCASFNFIFNWRWATCKTGAVILMETRYLPQFSHSFMHALISSSSVVTTKILLIATSLPVCAHIIIYIYSVGGSSNIHSNMPKFLRCYQSFIVSFYRRNIAYWLVYLYVVLWAFNDRAVPLVTENPFCRATSVHVIPKPWLEYSVCFYIIIRHIFYIASVPFFSLWNGCYYKESKRQALRVVAIKF